MSTIAFVRLHRFTACPERIWDALAPHVAGIVFTTNRLRIPDLTERACAHPKCLGIYPLNMPWNNHATLQAAARIVDRFAPDEVLMFDEDELPPTRIGEQLELWRTSGRGVMSFRYLMSVGDPDTVLAEYCYSYGWLCKAYKWTLDVSAAGFGPFCWPLYYAGQRSYECPYPLRHLACMTPEQQAERSIQHRNRSERQGGRWWELPRRTMQYDPDMTWDTWIKHAKGNPG